MMSKAQSFSTFVTPLRYNKCQKLLTFAVRRFAMHGYDRSALREIATTAGMKAGSIYYYFASKEDQPVAVHEDGIRGISISVKKLF